MEVKMINNYYNILAESLTKKYATPLNEAWGNAPDWMKGPLTRGNNTDNMLKSKVYQKAYANAKAQGKMDYQAAGEAEEAWQNAKGITEVDFADYQQPRGQYTSDSKKTLRSQFMEKGIDLNNPNMKFIEGEPPKSKNDPRIQPPNIGIWYIPSQKGRAYDQVYAQGINDLEKPFDPAADVGNYSSTPFKYFSVKKLAEISSKFCYIDGSTIEKRDYENIRQTRKDRQSDIIWGQARGQERIPEEERGNYSQYFVDKSGYIVIPSSQKYADKLKELKLKGWAKRLSNIENELNSLLSTYQKSIATIDMLDFDDDFKGSLNEFNSDFRRAVNYYKQALNEIAYIQGIYVTNSSEFLQELKASGFKRALDSCESYMKDAKDDFSDYMLSEIDI